MSDKTLSAQPDWLRHKQKVSVKTAAELNDISEDNFRRHYGHLIKKVSPRRGAVLLADAIAIGSAPKPSQPDPHKHKKSEEARRGRLAQGILHPRSRR